MQNKEIEFYKYQKRKRYKASQKYAFKMAHNKRHIKKLIRSLSA